MSSTITIGTAQTHGESGSPAIPSRCHRVFLHEVAEAGYEWIELGPYGYLARTRAS